MDEMIAGAQTSAQTDAEKVPAAIRMLSYYDPYGWMAKIGLIVPSSNTVNAHEWSLMAPEGISIHTARATQSGRSSRESFDSMGKSAEDAAGQLATAGVDIVAYGCTSGSFMGPRAELMQRLSDRAGCPATNSADSSVAALRALGVKTVALATPYMPYINDREISFLEEEGFSVCAWMGLGLGKTEAERFAIRKVPPEAIFRMAREVDRPEAEAIFLSCTSLPAAKLIASIEAQLGKPVVTSNQATFWNVLRMLNLRVRISGAGRLLQDL